jgi:hypothetical protein
VTNRRAYDILGALLGALATPFALFLAIASSGAGHGTYLYAKVCYPVPLLLTFGVEIRAFHLACAAVQLPLYGYLAAHYRARGVLLLMAIHGAAIALVFRLHSF